MDSLEIEILKDGTIKVSTGRIGPTNHLNADKFMEFVATKCGGEVTKTKRGRASVQEHVHVHEHVDH